MNAPAILSHPAWKPLPRTARQDCERYQVLALLRQHGTLNSQRAHELMPHIPLASMSTHLNQLRVHGHCWHVRLSAKRAVFFATPELQQAFLAGSGLPAGLRGDVSKSKTMPIRHAGMKLDPAAPAIVPEGVKVTQCLSWTYDPRFQLPPSLKRLPPDMKGAGFVAEWNRLRRAPSTPKKAAP